MISIRFCLSVLLMQVIWLHVSSMHLRTLIRDTQPNRAANFFVLQVPNGDKWQSMDEIAQSRYLPDPVKAFSFEAQSKMASIVSLGYSGPLLANPRSIAPDNEYAQDNMQVIDQYLVIKSHDIKGVIIDVLMFRGGYVFVVLQKSNLGFRIIIYGSDIVNHSAKSFGTNPIEMYKNWSSLRPKVVDDDFDRKWPGKLQFGLTMMQVDERVQGVIIQQLMDQLRTLHALPFVQTQQPH